MQFTDARRMCDVIQCADRVLIVEVDGRRNLAMVDREGGNGSLKRSGGTEQVTGHRLR